jgi:hypothetical protein
VEIILLDWTRMGKVYCLAGVVRQGGCYYIVRPLPRHGKGAPVRNVGWPPVFLDGHCRWQVFDMTDPEPAEPRPPHREDVWVGTLRPRRLIAAPDQRREILRATLAPPGQELFGTPLTRNRASAFLTPGTGERSLASITVPANKVRFEVSRREGAPEPDYRVLLDVPGLEGKYLSVKDHFLLRQAEAASPTPQGRAWAMTRAVGQMGPEVLVRLGLSRAFQPGAKRSATVCYLMADGFFSLDDPQP